MNQSGFERTTCACERCRACCKRQPGPLAAGDLQRIQQHLGIADDELSAWFCASPGALVHDTETGQTMRIGTITPKKRHGKCVFLDDNERCTIHAVAPFGCSHFDTHMGFWEGQRRSFWLARSQLNPEYQKQRDALPYTQSYKP